MAKLLKSCMFVCAGACALLIAIGWLQQKKQQRLIKL